jgi:hypothetical protein
MTKTATTTETENPRTMILGRIREHVTRAEAKACRLRRTNTMLIFVSTAASAVAAMLAGLTAARGPMVGQGPSGWRLTCGAVAVLSGCAGLVSGLHQQLAVTDRLTKTLDCAGKLRSLEIALTVNYRDPAEVSKDYEQVIREYQHCLF